MADIVDVLYRMRNMAGVAADDLRGAIAEAQVVLNKLEVFVDEAEVAAEGMADLSPRYGGGSKFGTRIPTPEGSTEQ